MADMVQIRGGQGGRYQAPSMRLGRSQFDLSHRHKTTFDASYLVPYFVAEVLPGDTQTCRLFSFVRIFSPLNAPIMDDIEVSIDFFFVPNRLLWDNWEAFLGAHDEAGAQDTDFTVPILGGSTSLVQGRVATYMGVPVGADPSLIDIQALPFRAYRFIYDEWYRDQNLIDKVTFPTDNGPDSSADVGYDAFPLKSAKKHDYFTSGLPYLQKGDPVFSPLSGTAPIKTDAATEISLAIYSSGDALRDLHFNGSAQLAWQSGSTNTAGNLLYADLAQSTEGISINALREAAAIQRLLERDARGGTRYVELIRAHFGVDVPDYRAQRPEYLGGGKGYVNVSPVANTSDTASADQGELAGVGAGTLQASWAKSFVEHGFVIGILRARGEISYSQGLDRFWSRSTKYDYPYPELAQLGEQPIYNKELYVSNNPAVDDLVFAYQERYAEMRFKKSLITGKFAPDASGSLDYWHLSEDFSSLPSLNQTFVEDQTPMSRVTVVDSEPDFLIDGRFEYKVARALPVRPEPSLVPARF